MPWLKKHAPKLVEHVGEEKLKKHLARAFNWVDKDKNGKITGGELEKAIAKHKKGRAARKAKGE